jgi:hypothetical protein
MRSSVSILLAGIMLNAALAGCSAFRKGAEGYEKVAARNEAGQLIAPAAPSENADASGGADVPSPVMASSEALNIEKAAKNLPRGLAGDVANVSHIGDVIPPK